MDNQQESFVKEVKRHPTLPVLVGNDGTLYNLRNEKRVPQEHRSGYLRIDLVYKGNRYHIPIHRAVAETFLEPPSEDLVKQCENEHHGKVLVLHKDNNKYNNVYTNLKWGTHQQNISEAFEQGLRRSYVGEGNPAAVLTEDIVRKVCSSLENGETRKDVMNKFGLTYNQIYFIHKRKSWKHISQSYNF